MITKATPILDVRVGTRTEPSRNHLHR